MARTRCDGPCLPEQAHDGRVIPYTLMATPTRSAASTGSVVTRACQRPGREVVGQMLDYAANGVEFRGLEKVSRGI